MKIAIFSNEELERFRSQLLTDMTDILYNVKEEDKKWLRSADVKKILGCSTNTLHNFRKGGILPYTKLGGTIYYDKEIVMKLLERNYINIDYGNKYN